MMIRTPNWNLWTRKRIALMAAIVALASSAAYASISLARSTPVESAVLSDHWQCTRTAGIVTVCTKKAG
jgi:hypothetical protein